MSPDVMPKEGGRRSYPPVFIALLAGGATTAEAALAAGVTERTGFRWKKDPELAAEVRHARAELTTVALGKLSGSMGRAAAVLDKLLDSEIETTKLSAARSVLQLGLAMRAELEGEARLQRLEELYGLRAAANQEHQA
jgi:hypothetical protein